MLQIYLFGVPLQLYLLFPSEILKLQTFFKNKDQGEKYFKNIYINK